jgi:aspartyl protease family protein
MRHAALLLSSAFALCAAGAALAQSVALSGILGAKALLVVDGGPPKSLAVGETHGSVTLVSVQANQAVVEIAGKRQTLQLGEAPVKLGGQGNAGGDSRIVLHAVSDGHFMAQGQINGRSVSLMVDTGASAVGISESDAMRIGLNYRSGQRIRMNTANGTTLGWLVTLGSVRLGSVDVYNVEAVVTPTPMPYVLLGNSYLNRFQMTRTNEQMVLEKRY